MTAIGGLHAGESSRADDHETRAEVSTRAELDEIEAILERQARRITELESALESASAGSGRSDPGLLAARSRRQATRIAELEDELAHARAAAEAARMLGLREATRRVELEAELHAVRRTRLWRYTRLPRRLYGGVRRRLLRRR